MSSLEDADKYTEKQGLKGHAIHGSGKPPSDYGIMYIPHKVLIDKDGKVVKNFKVDLPGDLDELLKEAKEVKEVKEVKEEKEEKEEEEVHAEKDEQEKEKQVHEKREEKVPTNSPRKVSGVVLEEVQRSSAGKVPEAVLAEAMERDRSTSPVGPPAPRLSPQLWVKYSPVLVDVGNETGLIMEAQNALLRTMGWLRDHAADMLVQTRTHTTSAGTWLLFAVILTIFLFVCVCLVAPNPFAHGLAKPGASGDSSKMPYGFRPVSTPSLGQLGQITSTAQASRRSAPPREPSVQLPPQPQPQPPSRSPRDSIEAFLCPGLVVPSGCECTLLVPRLTPQYQQKLTKSSMTQVTIDDVKGVPVFRASFCLPSVGGSSVSAASSSRCLVLTSTTSEATVFAFCRDSRAELGFEPAALAIHNAAGRPFGSLRLCRDKGSSGGYEVVTEAGFWVHLTSGSDGLLTAIDRQGRSLAAGEPTPARAATRTVRIGPLVDAGLLTLSILASDLMETAMAADAVPKSRR